MTKDDVSADDEVDKNDLDEDSVDSDSDSDTAVGATDDQDADGKLDEAVRRSIGPWLLVPIALAMALLCLQHWSTQTFVLSSAAAASSKHIYVNGFGAVSTDIAGADASNGNGPSLGGWLVLGCGVVLLLAGVFRGLDKLPRSAPIAAIAAAVVQIAVVIYSALVVNAQSGDFYSKMVDNARAIGIQITFSVGWGLWLELLFGFAALAVAIGVLVRERNVDILLVRS